MQKANRFFSLDLGTGLPSHTYIHSTIIDSSPMPAAALGTGDAKVSTGRVLALLGICNQESEVHEKILAFKPVTTMEEQNRLGVESIEVSLISSVKGGFSKQAHRDW